MRRLAVITLVVNRITSEKKEESLKALPCFKAVGTPCGHIHTRTGTRTRDEHNRLPTHSCGDCPMFALQTKDGLAGAFVLVFAFLFTFKSDPHSKCVVITAHTSFLHIF